MKTKDLKNLICIIFASGILVISSNSSLAERYVTSDCWKEN
jgi:hypothetical protein